MFGCSHPFPFWVHPFALFCTHRKRPVIKGSKKKSCNKKRRHHDKRLPLLFFNKLMFVTVGGRPGLAFRRAVATNGNRPPSSLPRPLLFYAGGGPSLNTRPTCEGGVVRQKKKMRPKLDVPHAWRGCSGVGKIQPPNGKRAPHMW